MKRFSEIILVAAIAVILICGLAGCGKKGPPVPRNPFLFEIINK